MARKNLCPAILLTALLALCLPTAGAAADREPMIVSTAWLAEHLNDPNLVILYVGNPQGYKDGHIPGAQHLDLAEISTPHEEGFMMQLPPAAQLKAAFEKLGVSDNSRVVVYFAKNWATAPARAFLTLEYLGLGAKTSYLDGGMPAWLAENRPVTKEVRAAQAGSITPRVRDDVVADVTWVSASLNKPGIMILDARTPQFYEGREMGARAGRLGHLAGARNLPFTALMDEASLKFKDVSALQELFRAAGVKPGDTVVTYCHIGMQASLLYFAARYLGYDARMYDGSFEEWSNRKDLPVEGPAPKPATP